MKQRRATDLTGRKFAFLTVIGLVSEATGRGWAATWRAQCVCGKVIEHSGNGWSRKVKITPKSCGCKTFELCSNTHRRHGMTRRQNGMKRHPAWLCWQSMKRRCTNPKNKQWHRYGGRGITICEQWLTSFDTFWADMGPSHVKGLTIERIDNDGNYEPSNCRWATRQEQSRNMARNRMIDTPRGRMLICEAADLVGISKGTMKSRVRLGFPPEFILDPVGKWGRWNPLPYTI